MTTRVFAFGLPKKKHENNIEVYFHADNLINEMKT